jgi:hypothetical protein
MVPYSASRPADVVRIAAIEDAALRNAWITQGYHELSVRMRALVGESDATWCAFGTWASQAIGPAIRGEAITGSGIVDPAIVRASTFFLRPVTPRIVAALAEEVQQRSARFLGDGNALVFGEVGAFYAALLDRFDDLAAVGAVERKALLVGLGRDGPQGALFALALDQLVEAARTPEGDPRRGQRLLLANAAIALHEQRGVQRALEGAFQSPLRVPLGHLIGFGPLRHLPWDALRFVLPDRALKVERAVTSRWATVLTDVMVTVETPTERIDVGEGLPLLPSGVLYPPGLDELSLPELDDFLAHHTRPGPVGGPVRSRDWTVLDDRMTFIIAFMRSRQHSPELFEPPFSAVQLTALAAGQLPGPA